MNKIQITSVALASVAVATFCFTQLNKADADQKYDPSNRYEKLNNLNKKAINSKQDLNSFDVEIKELNDYNSTFKSIDAKNTKLLNNYKNDLQTDTLNYYADILQNENNKNDQDKYQDEYNDVVKLSKSYKSINQDQKQSLLKSINTKKNNHLKYLNGLKDVTEDKQESSSSSSDQSSSSSSEVETNPKLESNNTEEQNTSSVQNTQPESSSSQESTTQTQQSSNTETQQPQQTEQTQSSNSQNQTQQSQDTSGFNFAGYHFPLASFSGSGHVPANNYVYQWTSNPNWYLLEQAGSAGSVVKQNVTIGTAITVNGKTYHVTDIKSGLSRVGDNQAGQYYANNIGKHAIGFQTCDYVNVLTLYFAD